jgi:hypothetical protein
MKSVIEGISDTAREKLFQKISTDKGVFQGTIKPTKLIDYAIELFGDKFLWMKKCEEIKTYDFIKQIILDLTTDADWFYIKENMNTDHGCFYYYMIEIYNYRNEYGYFPKFNSEKTFERK